MSKLGDTQGEFLESIGMLICYAFSQGYVLTLGDGYRAPKVFGAPGVLKGYGHPNSNHKRRLAMDFNLKIDGKLIWTSEHPAWDDLHDFFESLGGAPALKGDAGHFSFKWKGMT